MSSGDPMEQKLKEKTKMVNTENEIAEQSPLAPCPGSTSGPPPPKRRYTLELTLGADDMSDIEHALKQITHAVVWEGSKDCVSGGCGAGWNYQLTESEGMTHESYVKALNEYLAAKR